jgi:hypothetical protein
VVVATSNTQKTEAARISETLASFHKTIQRYNPENRHLENNNTAISSQMKNTAIFNIITLTKHKQRSKNRLIIGHAHKSDLLYFSVYHVVREEDTKTVLLVVNVFSSRYTDLW